jgi:hypothetical protein
MSTGRGDAVPLAIDPVGSMFVGATRTMLGEGIGSHADVPTGPMAIVDVLGREIKSWQVGSVTLIFPPDKLRELANAWIALLDREGM